MTHHIKAFGLAAAIALVPVAAPAATVDIDFRSFGSGNSVDTTGALAAQATFMGGIKTTGEDFEGFAACPATTCAAADSTSPIVSTRVGDFYRSGDATGGGNSQVAPADKIVVRNDDPDTGFGRYDVAGGRNWLDSNDHAGILWDIPGQSGLSDILRIAFFLTDVDDVGNFNFSFDITAGEVNEVDMTGKPNGRRPDGELLLVTMLFDTPVDLISLEMQAGTNDGYGLDGVQVGTVPLPASALLLLGGLGGLGGLSALRRRKQAA